MVTTPAPTPPPRAGYAGKTRLDFLHRLGDSWRDLATYFEIPSYDQARFERGDEGRRVLEWLENRDWLGELPHALVAIGRDDLVEVLQHPPR